MLNKIQIFLLLLIFTFVNSCSKDEIDNSISTKDKASYNGKKNSRIMQLHPIYTYLGAGYNATQSYANDNSVRNQVIDIDKFILENQSRILTVPLRTQGFSESYGDNALTYSRALTSKASSSFTIPLFKGAILEGSSDNSINFSNKFNAKYIYGGVDLNIARERREINSNASGLQNYLTAEFQSDLVNLTPAELVEQYGTHIMKGVDVGGKLQIKYNSETKSEDRMMASKVGLKLGVKGVFGIDLSNDVNVTSNVSNFNRSLSYITRGGDPSIGLVGQISLESSISKLNIENWQKSVTLANSVLVDFTQNSLILLYDLVSDPIKRNELKAYIDQYLIDNGVELEFIPKPIYRYFNYGNSDHYFTFNQGIYGGYNSEGIAFNAFTYKAPNTVPIYGYWNNKNHYLTTSNVIPNGYVPEGVQFYAYPTTANDRKPVYQYYKYKSGQGCHFYTTNWSELGSGNYGYNYYATPFYVPM